MKNIKEHLNMLGLKVEDKVTGFAGVITSVSFDLYGCVQAVVNPGLDKDGVPKEGRWYDIGRLKVKSTKPVMEPPEWDLSVLEAQKVVVKGKKGPAEKPIPTD